MFHRLKSPLRALLNRIWSRQRATPPHHVGPGSEVAAGPRTDAAMVFPGRLWKRRPPQSQALDPASLQQAIRTLADGLHQHGGIQTLCIVRNGYVIWEGAESERALQIYSATKSFTSTLLGLLIDDRRVTLDTAAHQWVPELTEHYPAVTLRHFATMTSGYDAQPADYEFDTAGRGDSWYPGPPAPPLFPPGTRFRYWDEAMMQFGLVLTRIAGEPLDQLFGRRIADPIGMRRWRWSSLDLATGRVLIWTAGVSASAKDLCRFGHLFLNRGYWSGRQLISSAWVDAATSVQVPRSIPNDLLPRSQGSGVYGYNWWTNAIQPDGSRRWPNAPAETYYASGLHGNVCIVVPSWKIVIARTNAGPSDGTNNRPADIDAIWDGFFAHLAKGWRGSCRRSD